MKVICLKARDTIKSECFLLAASQHSTALPMIPGKPAALPAGAEATVGKGVYCSTGNLLNLTLGLLWIRKKSNKKIQSVCK